MSIATASHAYDVKLKPRILLSLIKEELPGDQKPLADPSILSRIVRIIHTHGLLSESAGTEDVKISEKWKSTVDEWFSRLLLLISNTMPEKCWVGICLLGISCQECSLERFLASYIIWFETILLHIQSSKSSQMIKVACFSALNDLFKRLLLFPSEKKAAISCSDKVVQPLLKILKEEHPEALWESAVELLFVFLSSFSASVNRHYESVEEVITSKVLTGNCSIQLKKLLVHCLALLPRSKGDSSYWVSTIRKALLLVNDYLTEIFHGLEEESRSSAAVLSLFSPGEDIPLSIWGQKMSEETLDNSKKILKINCITLMMLTCSLMMKSSFLVKVPVPIIPLLNLIERVLLVDGRIIPAALPFVIASDQEFSIIELPSLHHNALDLLMAVMNGLSSHFLPYVPYVVRLVKEFMKKCQLPELRTKAYSIARKLLISSGIGTAIYFSLDVVENALFDLGYKYVDDTKIDKTNIPIGGGSLGKRKLDEFKTFPNPFLKKHNNKQLVEIEINSNDVVSNYDDASCVSLKIIALQTLETLFTVAGAIRSDNWRPKVEPVLIKIAMKCSKVNCGQRNQNAEFELAALKALLASVLSPSVSRPPHLASSLDLFRRGKSKKSSSISDFCTQALFSLEPLIHPRGLPLSSNCSPTIEAYNISVDSEDEMHEPFVANAVDTSEIRIVSQNQYPKLTSSVHLGRTQPNSQEPESHEDEIPKVASLSTTPMALLSAEILEDGETAASSPMRSEEIGPAKGSEKDPMPFHVSKLPVHSSNDTINEMDDDLIFDIPDIVDADPDSD